MSLFDLTGKVAIVTGSSRGIGRAIADEYAAHGARVVISSRKIAACQEVADAINAQHGEGTAIAIAASISAKPELEALIADTRAAFGRIDVLVCNAASNPYYGPQEGIADDQFRKILDNNIVSNHWLISMVAPAMRERGDGSIVIISSIGGLRGYKVTVLPMVLMLLAFWGLGVPVGTWLGWHGVAGSGPLQVYGFWVGLVIGLVTVSIGLALGLRYVADQALTEHGAGSVDRKPGPATR